MSSRRWMLVLALVSVLAVGLCGISRETEIKLDEVAAQYPEGYTRVLAADIALLLRDEALREAVMGLLGAARHPLNGIRQAIELLRLDAQKLPWVAHGAGPNLSSFSLIEGAPFEQTFKALQGLKATAGAPGSPYKHWEMVEIEGIPVIFTGGVFGPIPIEWAYIPLANRLWFGSEIGLGAPPNRERLRASAELIIKRIRDQVGGFPELEAAQAVPGGAIAFVRLTDPAKDKLVEADEEAMSYAVFFEDTAVRVHFYIRFMSEEAAHNALSRVLEGRSSYLAQDLYSAELIDHKVTGRVLALNVRTTLRGIAGLLILTMPL